MTTNGEKMYFNCLMIEALIKSMVIQGITDNKKLTDAVADLYHPETDEEMEAYSEAIIYAKHSILN
jgi:hypothetical protein